MYHLQARFRISLPEVHRTACLPIVARGHGDDEALQQHLKTQVDGCED